MIDGPALLHTFEISATCLDSRARWQSFATDALPIRQLNRPRH